MKKMATNFVHYKRPDQAGLWVRKSPTLTHLDIELTERCNFSCIHCSINRPLHDVEAQARELSTEAVVRILREAAELGCLSVRLSGGEPLVRKDFMDIYLAARRLGLLVVIFTNASLITEEIADLWARIPPLQKIEVSIYGMCPDSYQAVTGLAHSYQAVQAGVSRLLERKIRFIVKYALLPPNLDEKEIFERWAQTIPGMDGKPGCAMFYDLRTRRDWPAKNRQIQKLRLSPDAGLLHLSQDEEQYRQEMDRFCRKFLHPQGDSLFACGAGSGSGCVDAYGRFQLCMLLRHPDTVYDLKAGTLQQALEEFVPCVQTIRSSSSEYLERCGRCFLKSLCEQCPGKSWSEHGTLDRPVEYLCDIAHTQARYLGLIKDGERSWEIREWEKRLDHIISKGN